MEKNKNTGGLYKNVTMSLKTVDIIISVLIAALVAVVIIAV